MSYSGKLSWWLLALALVATLITGCASAAPAAPTATTEAAAAATSPTMAAAAGVNPKYVPVTGPLDDEAKALNGAGATFPQPLYSKWFEEYAKLTGVQVNYQGIGSGGGIKGISDQTLDFGASDGFMSDEQLAAAKGGAILHIPMALGSVGVVYNIPGVSRTLKFTGDTLAGIYLGEITKWNDPKLLADNPDAGLPDKDIVVVHRSDGSGTSFIFTSYLSAVSEKWKTSVGTGTSPQWPVGLGGKGNPGVAGEVQQNENSIGYVELIYALQNNISFGQVKNQAGEFLAPSLESTTAAAAGMGDKLPADLRASIVNAPGAGAYPIAGFTWILAYQNQTDPAKGLALARLLWWGIHDGQKMNADLHYGQLPDQVVKMSEEKILSITTNGKSILGQ
jgi:phosphate transport system substrate-binding protein